MSDLAAELSKLRLGLEGGASDEDFVASVMAACEEEGREPRPERARRLVWAYAAALSAAASVAIAVSWWPPQKPLDEAEASGTVTARGHIDEGLRATVQAFVGHAPPGAAPPLLEGATLRPGDGILVRYSNPSSKPVFLMVFALDRHDQVHWIHPAYLNEGQNPRSLELGVQVTHRVLSEVAEPEDAAPGALRVYALLSGEPLDVKSVERQLKAAPAASPVPALFPQAEVEEWRCTWAP
jgi:hypothetical protein